MIVLFRSIRILAVPIALSLLAGPHGARADLLDPITNLFGGGEKYKTEITPVTPAEDLYNQGLVFLKRNDFENAAKKFGELEKQYPFSQWARKGLLMTTFAQYREAGLRRRGGLRDALRRPLSEVARYSLYVLSRRHVLL